EAPLIRVEASEFLLYLQERPRILDRRLDLAPISDDAGVADERLDLARIVARDSLRVEGVERADVGLALAQDRDPAEAGLRAFEHQELEEAAIVVHGHAPFRVVIGD